MKLNRLTPNFKAADIRQTIRFYENVLGFQLQMAVPENGKEIVSALSDGEKYIYASLQKDDVEFMFEAGETFLDGLGFPKPSTIGASVSFYMEMDGVDELYAHVKQHNAEVSELFTTWYGMREFYLKDINGYILGFAQKA